MNDHKRKPKMNDQERLALRGRLAELPPDTPFTRAEAAAYCGAGGSTWARWSAQGDTPPAIRLTRKSLGYRKRDLDAWLDARTERPANAA